MSLCCILLNFYIKPQPLWYCEDAVWSCILLNFYIKPQLHWRRAEMPPSCILLNFYIKPQPQPGSTSGPSVVSYWISTSNHNVWRLHRCDSLVVSYWISTSNHNSEGILQHAKWLYLIEFLHQTTTVLSEELFEVVLYLIEFLHQTTTIEVGSCIITMLYLIEFLHQTTTGERAACDGRGCILLNFYIKPQLSRLS